MRFHRLCTLAASLVAAGLVPSSYAASFKDPTATVSVPRNLAIGDNVYIGPFANITTTSGVTVGHESNIQDSVTVRADIGPIVLGDLVILAHGSTVTAKSRIGTQGTCPIDANTALPKARCPSFVSFNAMVDQAVVEKDAMVSALAKVGSGVRIPSGRKVLPGKFISQQKQVDTKTVPVTEADRLFMEEVVKVNTTFANTYPLLASDIPNSTTGINLSPGNAEFNPERSLPTVPGLVGADPTFRNRIIGKVTLAQDTATLGHVMGNGVSLRADEGPDFRLGAITSMGDNTTFHALVGGHIDIGSGATYGVRSIVHGGPTPFAAGEHADNVTVAGPNFSLGQSAVFYRSKAGSNVVVGNRSVVQQCVLGDNTSVPALTVRVCDAATGGTVVLGGAVEW